MSIKPLLKHNYLAMALAVILPSHAFSDSLEQRVATLEKKAEKNSDAWYENLTFSGFIELEAIYVDPDSGESQSDLIVATAELGAQATLTKNLSTNMVLLYEEELGEGDNNIEVDIATINYTHGNHFTFVVGQEYVPFGAYNTNLNDTLALEIGEARETAFITHYNKGGFHGAFYLFNGDNDEDGEQKINDYGARLSFSNDIFSIGGDFISNLGDSDGLTDFIDYNLDDDVISGAAAFAKLTFGKVTFFAEHLSALDGYTPEDNAEPSASQLEATIEAGGITYAASYQETDEAEFLELPEERISVGLKTEIVDHLQFSIELARDEDYTDNTTNLLIVELAAEF